MKLLIMISLLAVGCGRDIKVESFETKAKCFRGMYGIECFGKGLYCSQTRGSSGLVCRVTIMTKNGKRSLMPSNPVKGETIHLKEVEL